MRGLLVWKALIPTVLLAVLSGGCRQAPMESLIVAAPPEEAAEVYVILPDHYSGYVNEGLMLESGGQPEDLPVYHSEDVARKALRAFESQDERNRHIWRVYRLDADWNKDVVPQGKEYRLRSPAKVAEPLPK